MNNPERQLLEFISRLTYNIEGLSLSTKLYISQVLTFHFSNTLSEDFIRDVENKRAAKSFKNTDELLSASAEFSPEQRAWCVAVLLKLKEQVIQSGNRKLSISIDGVIAKLTELFGSGEWQQIIDRQLADIEREIDLFQNRKVVRIPVSIWPLVLDFALRCLLLIYFSAIGHNTSNLTALNLTAVPAIILLVGFFVSRRHRKYNLKLLDNYGGAHQFKIESSITAGQYTWMACFLAISVFISYLLPDQLHAFAFFGLTLYYFVFLRFFHVGRLDENDLMRQLENNVGGRELYSVDQNDEEIVRLETRLNSFTNRLDAYVLESALFGALTFSGFLQIMASDLVSFTDLENFATLIFNTSRGLINLEWTDFNNGLAGLNTKVSLLCLVSLESLICSGFFLAVIASRLRFSDVADRVRTLIEMAKVYNAKEEALIAEHELTERQPGRLRDLTDKVNEQIHSAIGALERVNPVMTYMHYFRNAGILVFLMILVSSSLFITSVLGWTFIAIVGATYIYFNYSRLNLSIRGLFLNIRITFMRRAFVFLLIALSPFGLWIVFASVYPQSAVLLLALGNLTVGLYIFVWLILAAHADRDFGEIEDNKTAQRTGRWLLVKNSLAFTMLMWGVANAFKQRHLAGANEMIMISLTFLAILMYFVGYYLSKIRWLGVICGWILAVAAVGVLFKTFHLGGADDMQRIALVFMIIITPVLIWKRRLFHGLLLRLMTITIALTVLLVSGIMFKIQLAASHRTTSVNTIEEVLTSNTADAFDLYPDRIPAALEKCDWYMKTYGERAGYSPVYNALIRNYQLYLEVLLAENTAPDTTKLMNALLVARQAARIRSLFGYQDYLFGPTDASAESSILLALGKKEEAIQSLESLLRVAPDEDFKKAITTRLADIRR